MPISLVCQTPPEVLVRETKCQSFCLLAVTQCAKMTELKYIMQVHTSNASHACTLESHMQLMFAVNCNSWTVDSGLDCGLDCGLRFGLDLGLIHSSMTTFSNTAAQWMALIVTQFWYLLLFMLFGWSQVCLITASLFSFKDTLRHKHYLYYYYTGISELYT